MHHYIREGRFGPPKCWKTGAVVSSYPRPILVFEYEPGGLDIIAEEPEWLMPENAASPTAEYCAIDLTPCVSAAPMSTAYTPLPDAKPFDDTVKAINTLRAKMPYKTIVIDTVTGLSDRIYNHVSKTNNAMLADARKWAGAIGMKVSHVIDYVQALPCHSVFIFHTEVNKNEDVPRIFEQPMVYSKLRDFLGAKFSQFFYQHIFGGKPVIRTKPFDIVTGIGSRWPRFTKDPIGPTFKEIYGDLE